MTDHAHAEQLFHAITEAANSANIGVAVMRAGVVEPDLDLIYMNTAMQQLLGYSREEIAARGLWASIAPDALSPTQVLSTAYVRGETIPATFQSVLLHRDGRRIPVDLSLGFIQLDGRPAAVAFVVDITARQQTEDELRRSRELFQRVIAIAPDGILILRWPKVLFANPVAARLLEVARPEDAVGMLITDRLTPDDAAVAKERVDRKLDDEPLIQSRTYRSWPPSGREQWIEISSIPIDFEGGPAVLAFARDVTERNAMMARLVETDKLAAVSTLAAGVAHEINNPLAYALLNLELLARELRALDPASPRIEPMLQRLDDARQGAERVKAIVRDLQALTRKDENIRGPVELDQVLEHALHMARHELRDRARIEKHFQAVPEVSGNPTQLEQLFFNLIVNAAHAMSETPKQEHVLRMALSLDARGFVVADVVDDGCGMSDEVLARAFEPFFTTKALGVGSGLGLPICKRIVDDLGGKITVESHVELGTRVRVQLRAWAATQTVDAPASRRPRGRVLVVDDERAVAESLSYALKDDHDIDIAGGGKEARAALEAGKDYDVILCDLVMPVESGMDLHAHAQKHHPELAERFVFMTGGAFTPRASKFLSEVRAPRIEKPFELETLRALIDGMVAARRSDSE